MELKSIFPFNNKESVRGLTLSILIDESPLKIFEIVNIIKKRYGKKISFQAVSKEVLSLSKEGVLIKKDRDIYVDKDWVKKLKETADNIHEKIILQKKVEKDSLGKEVSVIIFDSLAEAMNYWYKIIDNWFDNFKKGDYNINCWQFSHLWEALIHLDQEVKSMSRLKEKGIKSYAIMGTTKLDKDISKLYNKLKIKTKLLNAKSFFDKTYSMATYGDYTIQVKYPENAIKKIDEFFKKNNSIDSFKLSELLDIVKEKNKVKMTLLKNIEIAKQINKSILIHFK